MTIRKKLILSQLCMILVPILLAVALGAALFRVYGSRYWEFPGEMLEDLKLSDSAEWTIYECADQYALLAQSAPPKEAQLDFGRLKIAPQSHRVYVDGKEVSFPNKEYELLLLLAENPNIVFSKEQLYDRIWGMDALGDTKTVMVHINRVREKIEKNLSRPEYIETVWGVGYRFTCL